MPIRRCRRRPFEAVLADQIASRFPQGLADYVSMGKQREKEQKGLCVVRVDAGGPCALILALESLHRHLLARSMLCLAGGVRVDAGRDLEARQRSK